MMKCSFSQVGSVLFFGIFAINLSAQELEPRNYAVVPKNMNVGVMSYTISRGNVVADATSPIQDLQITSSIFIGGYARTFSLFGRLSRVQMLVPFTFLSGSAQVNGMDTTGARTGFADARFRFGINVLGSPAISAADFQRFKEETVLGVSFVVSVPIGQYYSEKLINLGTNRWGFKPEIGFSHREGRWYFEAYTGVWLFSVNNEFLQVNTLEQDPLFAFQTHVSYLFPTLKWVALNVGYTAGGRSSLNDSRRNDEQRNLRLGATFSLPLDRRQSLKFLLNAGVATRAGTDFNAFTVVYQYAWLKKPKPKPAQ